MSQRADLRGRVLLIEDYDMVWGRLLTQGVDLWLNNPRRPREASGTSGQKVCLNGGLNFSVLDGWWPEGFNGENGWSIGEEKEYENLQQQDEADAESLYSTLEEKIVPAFYDRDSAGHPQAWLHAMRECIATCLPLFNTHRMVRQYFTELYRP